MDASMDHASPYNDILDPNWKIKTEFAYRKEYAFSTADIELHTPLKGFAMKLGGDPMYHGSLCPNNFTSKKLKHRNNDSSCNSSTAMILLNDTSSIGVHEILDSVKRIAGNLVKASSCVEKIAEILFKEECKLSDVVCLQNVELTKAFLNEQQNSMSDADFYANDAMFNRDFRMSIDRVMSFLDLEHTEVVLKYGRNREIKIRYFFKKIAAMATAKQQQRDLKTLILFVKSIAKWNILTEEMSMIIEQEVFFKADKEVIQIFLQAELDRHIERLFGVNVMAALFGNRNIKISYLKRNANFNVNVRGSNNSTALHYAVKSKNVKKIKYLLDRGFEPNSTTSTYVTALNIAMCEPDVNPIETEKCAELLLQYGADPSLLTSQWKITPCCTMALSLTSPTVEYVSIGYLSKLVLAHICMHNTAGTNKQLYLQTGYYGRCSFLDHMYVPYADDNLLNFRSICQREIQLLKQHEIRANLTMFTVALEPACKLIGLLNEEDCKIIDDFVNEHSKSKTLNRYYLNVLREHVRQVRKFIAHRKRAMSAISASIKIRMPLKVLDKIISYLSYKDLLIFQ